MITLSRSNLATIEESLDFARRVGASGLIFERFVPLGRGRQMADQVLLPADWHGAVCDIAACAGLQIEPQETLPFHAYWLHLDGREECLQGAACNLGESMALMPDGTVFACRRLPIPVGNALAQSMVEIRNRLAGYAPDALRHRLHGPVCRNCSVPACAGCRALALAMTGDWLADDPRCVRRLESEGDSA